nr:hypothetical protein [Clostridioides sp.]
MKGEYGIAKLRTPNLNNFTKDVYIVDKKTGEVIDQKGMKQGEMIDIIDYKDIITPKQKKLLNNINSVATHSSNLGGFIFLCYVKNKLLFNELNIDRANITRLIYLSTYLHYNTDNKNLLIKHTQYKKIVPLDKILMKKILKLEDRTFYNFLNDVKYNNLLYEEDNKFYLNPEYFTKGEVEFNTKEYTRIYINTTRLLYENTTVSKHKQLSYIYQLIPFIHYETNILVKNPNEMDLNKLEKLSLIEICELLKINITNRSRTKKDLLRFNLIMNEEKYNLLKYVKVEGDENITDYFVVNPSVVWKGHNIEMAKEAMKICFWSN